ncbi:Methanogen homoaconitase large subunit [Candidatus Bilamarchaeum dharawalense]|uniref:Methanogen homoaconitase large subunit n=1 Tax=Candidatus Bilamarchaeum dharawalense TaxID=2885759 RepID=A0A5E4LMH2_9ARCH|nr:Methanogen homoaconitase large subunit [Candidatus Bilamarchaeum dharawalense]
MSSLTEKIIKAHLEEGETIIGQEIAIKIDQTLTQDATGTMAYLEFEAMGLPRVAAETAVSYVDHNTLQTDFRNQDDHLYLQSVAEKFGVHFSRAGNGICHQVHLERFAAPGKTVLGSDSHTPTAGGVGAIAIGAGGLDVAIAMGGGPFYFEMPKVVGVKLTGKLPDWSSAKDVILELLRKLTVKGGVGKVFEYFGPGVDTLSVPERATITNMGAELGATTSIFPSDQVTLKYLKMQSREHSWKEMCGDGTDSDYSEIIELDLSKTEPLLAKPHSPDAVVSAKELKGTKVNQVIVGSCTNSSYKDLMTVAAVMKGRKVHPNVSFAVVPGSKQVYEQIARNGALADLISAGARILESACGPCIGMGQAPSSGGVSIRSFNRNFQGRCGTPDASVYLASPEVCAACAIRGEIVDPRELGAAPKIDWPAGISIDDSMIIAPKQNPGEVQIIRGPNIKPLPDMKPLENSFKKEVLLKLGDNVTTDHIMPAGAKVLPLRSNIPAISEFVFSAVDPKFVARAKEKQGGIVIGGDNYGQGSSREHAAIAPLYLGVKAVIVKKFARIHKANLLNFGILPLTFADPADYDKVEQGDVLELDGIVDAVKNGGTIRVKNITKNYEFLTKSDATKRNAEMLLAGGLINLTKERAKP